MTKTFETNKRYFGRFICDSDSRFEYRIVRRTTASVWIERSDRNEGEVLRKAVKTASDGTEYFFPMGSGYSMAPTVHADRVAA